MSNNSNVCIYGCVISSVAVKDETPHETHEFGMDFDGFRSHFLVILSGESTIVIVHPSGAMGGDWVYWFKRIAPDRGENAELMQISNPALAFYAWNLLAT